MSTIFELQHRLFKSLRSFGSSFWVVFLKNRGTCPYTHKVEEFKVGLMGKNIWQKWFKSLLASKYRFWVPHFEHTHTDLKVKSNPKPGYVKTREIQALF